MPRLTRTYTLPVSSDGELQTVHENGESLILLTLDLIQ